ncbi:MAG TPA: RICIN domain-containing protein [Armatimonadota bacterium]|jgi:hypothetical protein
MSPKLFISISAVVALSIAGYAQARAAETGFAIQNVLTGKNLRPFDAGSSDGNKIVLYDHSNWKCMTWKFEKVSADTFQLRNLFTAKTIQPTSTPKAGVALVQQPLKKGAPQLWEFLKQPGGTYLIRLKGTALFVSTSSDKTNSAIVLDTRRKDKSQVWRTIEQSPLM